MTAVLIIAETPRHAARIAAARHLPDGAWIWLPDLLSAGNYQLRVRVQFNVTCAILTEARDAGAINTNAPLSHRSGSNRKAA
jgi:hypothetical protein